MGPNYRLGFLDLALPCLLGAVLIVLIWIAAWLFNHTYTPPQCCKDGHPKVVHPVNPPGALTPRAATTSNTNNTNSTNQPGGGIVLCK